MVCKKIAFPYLPVMVFSLSFSLPAVLQAKDRSFTYAGLGATASTASVFYWRHQGKQMRNLEKQISVLEKKLEDKNVTDEKEIKITQKLLKESKEKLKHLKRKKRVAQASTLVSGALALFFLGKKLFADNPEDDTTQDASPKNRDEVKPYILVFPPNAVKEEVDAFNDENYFKHFTGKSHRFSLHKDIRDGLRGYSNRFAQNLADWITHTRDYNVVMDSTSPLLNDHVRFMNKARELYRDESERLIDIARLGDQGVTVDNFWQFAQNLGQLQTAIDEYKASMRTHFSIMEHRRLHYFMELTRRLIQLTAAQQQGPLPQALVNETAKTVRDLVGTILNIDRRNLSHFNDELEYTRKRYIEAPREMLYKLEEYGFVNKSLYGDFLGDFDSIEQEIVKIERIIDAVPATDSNALQDQVILRVLTIANSDSILKKQEEIFEIIKDLPKALAIKAVRELQVSPRSNLRILEVQWLIDKLAAKWTTQHSASDAEIEELLYYSPKYVNKMRSIPEVKFNMPFTYNYKPKNFGEPVLCRDYEVNHEEVRRREARRTRRRRRSIDLTRQSGAFS